MCDWSVGAEYLLPHVLYISCNFSDECIFVFSAVVIGTSDYNE